MLLLSDPKYNNGVCPILFIDRNRVVGSDGNQDGLYNGMYLLQHNLLHAGLPVYFNGFDLKTYTILGSTASVREKLNRVLSRTAVPNTIEYYRIYADKETFPSFHGMFNESFKRVEDETKTFFDKMCDDANAREREYFRDIPLHVEIYYNPETLTVFEFVSRQDHRQLSDVYLILGMLPVFFPSLKEKLEPKEEDYFKTLIRRSQIKRITNNIAEKAFRNIVNLPKYVKAMEDVRLKNIMDSMLQARIREAQTELSNISNNITRMLQDYEEQLNRQQAAQHQLLYVEESLEETRESLRSLLDMKCVHNISSINDNSALCLDIRVPVDNYNPHEAELILNNYTTNADVIKLLKEIFVEQKYVMYFAHTFIAKPGSQTWSRASISINRLDEIQAMCNPHLYNFSCYGSYQPILQKAHQQKDFNVFASTAAVCTANLNFADSAVFNWFVRACNSSEFYNIKCIEDEDKKLWSIKEIMDGHNKIEIEDLNETVEPEELDINEEFI